MENPRRIALEVAYSGHAFFGFQRQPGFPTVQGELEQAWLAVSAEPVTMIGSGRTDTGVHARAQVVHFDTWSRIATQQLHKALNAYLPEEIVVRRAVEVGHGFHSNGSAIGKRYVYFLAVSDTRPVLANGRMAWERRAHLDLHAMRQAVPHVIGTHDFGAFAAAGRTTADDVRTLQAIHLRSIRGGFSFSFQGTGFLYKMVRNLVGGLMDVGRGRHEPAWMGEVLRSKDRRQGAATAHAEGLYLWRVLYPKPIFGPNQRIRPDNSE
ncbi:MAG: tRNA pseudouridine(38-40) synthase TruA [Planctomycetes bacterium]|nr:tRNA pseudouridine(38-40) synthase TruA [Planctomycetota bacterium]